MMRRRLRTLWHKTYSWWFEFYLGIDTRGLVAPPTDEGVHYTPLPYPMIVQIIKSLNLQPDDVFVDVGCGKGRVVCCVCREHIRKVVAIELNGALLKNTLENVARVRHRRARVDAVAGSADEYDYSDATIVYLYNPFNARLTGLVMERLFQSYLLKPRRMRVVYANPVHETVMREHNWLRKFEEWQPDKFPGFGYPVSFWETH